MARCTNESLFLLFSTNNILLAFTSESISNASSTTINALLKLCSVKKIRINWLRSWIRQLGHFLPNKTLVSRLGILQPHSFLFKPEGTEIHELIIAKPVFKGLIITSWRHRSQATIWLSSFFTKEITALSDHIPCKNVGRKFLSRQLLNRFSKSKRVDVTALNWTICLTQYIKTEKKLQV